MGGKQAFDPINVADAFADQLFALAMNPLGVFLFDRGHPTETASTRIPAIVSGQGPEHILGIDAIGLGSPAPAIDQQARRIENMIANARGGERSMQPEAVVSRFVTRDECRRPADLIARFLFSGPQQRNQCLRIGA